MTYTYENRRRSIDSAYRRQYILKKTRGIPTNLINSAPAAEHVRALTALGWSYNALEMVCHSKVTSTTLNNLADQRYPTISRTTATAALTIPYTLNVPDHVQDQALVPALGAQRRIHALLRLGWRHTDIRNRALDTTHLARGTYTQMLAWRWRVFADIFDQLSMQIGPSQHTAARSKAAGFPPPLAWTDVDNPDEKAAGTAGIKKGEVVVDPVTVDRLLHLEHVPSTVAEKEEAMRRWTANGGSARSFARHHGWREGRYTGSDAA